VTYRRPGWAGGGAFACAALLAACFTPPVFEPGTPSDAVADTTSDAGDETAVTPDARPDTATPDATADAAADATSDAVADATPDADADATPDADADATPDADADATPDADADGVADTVADTSIVCAPSDVAPQVSLSAIAFGKVFVNDLAFDRDGPTLTVTAAADNTCLSVNLTDGPFRFVGGAPPGMLGTCDPAVPMASGETCALHLAFAPTGAEATYPTTESSATLTIANGSASTALELTGTAIRARHIETSGYYGCAALSDDSLRCWGTNYWDQLGIGPSYNVWSVTPVALPPAGEVAAIETNDATTCVLMAEGPIFCWGAVDANYYGSSTLSAPDDAFGSFIGSFPPANSQQTAIPTKVPLPGPAKALSMGDLHGCAILGPQTATDMGVEGDVYCWGVSDYGYYWDGQPNTYVYGDLLGAGGVAPGVATPVKVVGINSPVVAIDTAESHSCAVTDKGAVFCWGHNHHGQLGDGTTTPSTTAVQVAGVTTATDVAVSSALWLGSGSSTCIKDEAGVTCFGQDDYGQLGNSVFGDSSTAGQFYVDLPAEAVSIEGGAQHYCAGLSDGDIYCWGANNLGQGGVNAYSTVLNAPAKVVSGGAFEPASVKPSQLQTCAIDSQGVPRCWGDGVYKSLGDGGLAPRPRPGGLHTMPGKVVSVAAGDNHACVVLNTGRIKCWGNNDKRQCGTNNPPMLIDARIIPGASGAVQVAAGASHSCALGTNGQVRCWGDGAMNALGVEPSNGEGVSQPQLVADLPKARFVTAGGHHSCAITQDQQLYCWGSNSHDQLGAEALALPSWQPTHEDMLPSVSDVALGARHICAISEGDLYCWGDNDAWQAIPEDNSELVTQPAFVPLPGAAIDVEAGDAHTCVKHEVSGGTVAAVSCWGANLVGQAGGPLAATAPAVQITASTDALGLALGGGHTAFIDVDGHIRSFGLNNTAGLGAPLAGGIGILGNSAFTEDTAVSETSVDVEPFFSSPDTAPVALTAGYVHTCVLDATGMVHCWGVNAGGDSGLGFGQCGIGDVDKSGIWSGPNPGLDPDADYPKPVSGLF